MPRHDNTGATLVVDAKEVIKALVSVGEWYRNSNGKGYIPPIVVEDERLAEIYPIAASGVNDFFDEFHLIIPGLANYDVGLFKTGYNAFKRGEVRVVAVPKDCMLQ